MSFQSNRLLEFQPSQQEKRPVNVGHTLTGDIEVWRNWIQPIDKRIEPMWEKRQVRDKIIG